MDNPNVDVKEYFKEFIKNKKIDELISYDNKLFSEVRNLESEKHVLVTQNYKKFVSATETINTIKTSLVGFEKDLMTLQGKVNNLVNNFNTINSSVEDKLKQTEEIYKIKKDLKRLKFISDLPSVLENQLKFYMSDPEKNIKHLEKSLIYYEKCKEFIKIHKDNTLVKDIYERTSEFVYKYRCIIDDTMNTTEFNEFQIEKFETCLGLLVKIDDDKTELINTFITRYKGLIAGKFESMFAMKNGVNEIDYELYSKIYDNYEFAINENDFLFYENQIQNNQSNLNNPPNANITLNLSTLTSKYFKKGTFIWICKQVAENIVSQMMISIYDSFINLFGEDKVESINEIFNYCVKLFNDKINSLLSDYKPSSKLTLDPIFFREGLLSFYKSFLTNVMVKVGDKINKKELMNTILVNNKHLIDIYVTGVYCSYIESLSKVVKESIEPLISKEEVNYNQSFNFKKLNINEYFTQVEGTFSKAEELFKEFSSIFKNLNLDQFNENEALGHDTEKIYFRYIKNLFGVLMMILQSYNKNHFKTNFYENYFVDSSADQVAEYKNIIITTLGKVTREAIYFSLFLVKQIQTNQNVSKSLIDKLLLDFPNIKKSKVQSNDLKGFIEKESKSTMTLLFDAMILFMDSTVYKEIKSLFFDVNFAKNDTSPVTFRMELKKLMYEMYQVKIELNDILEEEFKKFEETKATTMMTDSFNPNGGKKGKSAVQLEMEKLQIRRLSIYGESVQCPQMINYVVVKIFFKTLNEMIKMKKFSVFGYQQVQIDLSFICNFFKNNLIYVDVENILEGFYNEIIRNCAFNTLNYDKSSNFSEDLINDMINIHVNEFKEIGIVDQSGNKVESTAQNNNS